MTVRMATCQEMAADKQTIADLRRHYFDIEQNTTPASVLLPWFPSPARKKKTKATLELYLLIKKYVTMRREAKTSSSDAIDFLIANGDSDGLIIRVSELDLFYRCGSRFEILIYRLSWALFLLGLSTPASLVSVCYRPFIHFFNFIFHTSVLGIAETWRECQVEGPCHEGVYHPCRKPFQHALD